MTVLPDRADSSRRRLALLAVPALAAAALLLGCTSSGDGGAGTVQDFFAMGAEYESDAAPPTGSFVRLEQLDDERSSACYGVFAERAVDLFSVAFTLSWSPAVFAHRSNEVGPFLEDPDSMLLTEVAVDDDAGRITVGISRNSSMIMEGVTGSDGLLFTVCFDIVGEANDSPLTFVPNLAGEDPSGTVVIPPSAFVGGRVTTR